VHTDVDNLILLYLITVRVHRRRVLLLQERVISAHKTRNYDRNADILLLLLFLTMLPRRTGNAIKVRYSGYAHVANTRFLFFIRHDGRRRPSSSSSSSSFVTFNLITTTVTETSTPCHTLCAYALYYTGPMAIK